MGSLLAGATRREPLAAADGLSGSPLERVVLAGGEVVVVKHVRAGGDWIMRATRDGVRCGRQFAVRPRPHPVAVVIGEELRVLRRAAGDVREEVEQGASRHRS
jgi:hypothetical protein